jgi:hypothetical protein
VEKTNTPELGDKSDETSTEGSVPAYKVKGFDISVISLLLFLRIAHQLRTTTDYRSKLSQN